MLARIHLLKGFTWHLTSRQFAENEELVLLAFAEALREAAAVLDADFDSSAPCRLERTVLCLGRLLNGPHVHVKIFIGRTPKDCYIEVMEVGLAE